MKKNIIFLLITVLFFTSYDKAFCQATWVKSFGSESQTSIFDIVQDDSGNVYMCGKGRGDMDYDPGPAVVTAQSGRDAYLMKFDSAGNFLWVKTFGGSATEQATAIAMDDAGYIYIAGDYLGTVDFDPGPGVFTISGLFHTFLSKFTPDGTFVWAKAWGSTVNDIAIKNDKIYIAGSFQSTVDFNPSITASNTLTCTPGFGSDVYVLTLDTAGNFIRVKQIGGPDEQRVSELTLDNAGNILLCGLFRDQADFDPGPDTFYLTSVALDDGYIVKLDSVSNYIWAGRIGGIGNGNNEVTSIAVDMNNNIYATTTYNYAIDVDPGPDTVSITATGIHSDEAAYFKLSPTGQFIWARSLIGSDDDWAKRIRIDNQQKLLVLGVIGSDSINVDPGYSNLTLVRGPAIGAYLISSTLDGTLLNAGLMAGGSYGVQNQLLVAADNSLFITGAYIYCGTPVCDFDPGPGTYALPPLSGITSHAFIGNYHQQSVPLPINTIDFTGQALTDGNMLRWITINEERLTGFSLEYSMDGVHFNTLTYQPANAGISDKNYFYVHSKNAILNNRKLFYRLKILKNDQSFTFSKVIMVERSGHEDQTLVIPNPVNRYCTVYGNGISQIQVSDVAGKIISHKLLNNVSSFAIDMANYQPGLYIIKIYSNNVSETKRVVKL